MWQSVINYFQSLRTYRDMSPDIGIRRQVNARLRDRPRLSLDAWVDLFPDAATSATATSLLSFLYQKLATYSGLDVGRIRPQDRLVDDLQLPLVCWFDWPCQLCDDFYDRFQVDISEAFDESLLETVEALVTFLYRQLKSCDSMFPG